MVIVINLSLDLYNLGGVVYQDFRKHGFYCRSVLSIPR